MSHPVLSLVPLASPTSSTSWTLGSTPGSSVACGRHRHVGRERHRRQCTAQASGKTASWLAAHWATRRPNVSHPVYSLVLSWHRHCHQRHGSGQRPGLKRIMGTAPPCWPRAPPGTMYGSNFREDSILVGRTPCHEEAQREPPRHRRPHQGNAIIIILSSKWQRHQPWSAWTKSSV